MLRIIEQLFIAVWNRSRKADKKSGADSSAQTRLGLRVTDGETTKQTVSLSETRRTTHMAVLGKTGSGKSSLLKYLALQDIAAGRGFLYLDLHGDATAFLLRAIAKEEWRRKESLAERVIVIAPGDRDHSVGLNPLETAEPDFVRIAEFAEVLRERWGLDHFGARTDELLRNALFVLAANSLTLLELAPLLTNSGFLKQCLKAVPNAEVQSYFTNRYGAASEAMRAVMREPVLNKTSAFVSDTKFRHIVGQRKSTFSLKAAMDAGCWVIVNLEKGKLGAQATTLASLIFTAAKNALFAREKKQLFTLYADELQNLVSQSSDVETMFSEARKFGVGIVSANQFLDQYPPAMRAAVLSVGTHAFFQLTSADAGTVTQILDGGKSMTERLKNLPQRHFVLKSGAESAVEVVVPNVADQGKGYGDLLTRSRAHSSRLRTDIEREIAERQRGYQKSPDQELHDWD